MSWGERSCIHFYSAVKPCSPSMETCGVDCTKFRWDGITTPDTSKTIQKDTNVQKEHTGLNRAQRRDLDKKIKRKR